MNALITKHKQQHVAGTFHDVTARDGSHTLQQYQGFASPNNVLTAVRSTRVRVLIVLGLSCFIGR